MRGRRTRLLAAAFAAVLCALLWAVPLGALTLEEYTADVAEAHRLAAEAPAGMSEREGTDLARALSERVPATLEVETPYGPFDVDNSVAYALVASLETAQSPQERTRAVTEIEAHLASLVRLLGTPGSTVAEDPEALSRLLSEQAPRVRSPFSEYFGTLVERLGKLLERWWSTIGASPGASTALTTVTIVIVAVLVLILLWMVARAIMRARAGTERRIAPLASIGTGDAVVEAARDLPTDALAYADECAAAGDTREAVRALFGGAARELQEAGFIVEARMRTNRDLLLEVRPRSEATYAPLESLSRVFERAWYGHRTISAEEYSQARAWFLSIREAREGDRT